MTRTSVAVWLCLAGLLFVVVGCSDGGEYGDYDQAEERTDVGQTSGHAGHQHHEHGGALGPHQGHLIELGEEEYHAELVFDKQTRKTTVYILGSDAKTPEAIEQPDVELHLAMGDEEVELTLKAVPLEDDAEGKSSRFELPADELPESIDDEEKFEGHLLLTIAGKRFEGELAHHEDEKSGE